MQIYRYAIEVESGDIDFNGHVNNEVYLHWMIEAATRHSDSLGYGYEKCLSLGGTWVAKSHHIEYKRPAFEGEILQMQTWVEGVGKTMSRRYYKLVKEDDDTLICDGLTEWVFVDTKRARPMKIPQEMIEAFEDEASTV